VAFDTIHHSILIIVSLLGLGFTGLSSVGLNLFCHLDLSVLSVTAPSLPLISPHVVFLIVLFSVLFCSSCTLSHTALLFHFSL